MNVQVEVSVYTVVSLRHTDETLARVTAYLYAYTTIVTNEGTLNGVDYYIVKTTVKGTLDDTELRTTTLLDGLTERAKYLAGYQCGRLHSGGIFAKPVGTLAEATSAFVDLVNQAELSS
jgi:hypothetical protein